MIKFIKNFFGSADSEIPSKLPAKSFTYFIPAPPSRSSGYREKSFDKLFHSFMNRGHELIEIKTAPLPPQADHLGGIWVICIVRPLNEEVAEFDFNFPAEEIPLVQTTGVDDDLQITLD